jgi:putative PIN family toxin of toxin-antitoxin system
MGKKKKEVAKAVLDTNVLVSALILKGQLKPLVEFWQKGAIILVFTRETFLEFLQVLEYPRFSLAQDEKKAIVEIAVYPYARFVEPTEILSGVCMDPDDDKFLTCVVSAGADYLVSGDRNLLRLKRVRDTDIIKPSELIKILDA